MLTKTTHSPYLPMFSLSCKLTFFIELWEKFLQVSKYPKSQHYVSPQCAKITHTLIHGLLQVVIIYCDYSGGNRLLLLWLLLTFKHVFGLCQQVVKDFTMLDFQYMVPKLFIKFQQAVQSHIHRYTRDQSSSSVYLSNK